MAARNQHEGPVHIVFSAPADEGVAEAVGRLPGVTVEEHPALEGDALREAAARAELLVPRSFQSVDRAVLEAGAARGLQAVVQASAGLDNIDHEAAAELGIRIEAPDPGNATAVAELVLLSLLTLWRGAREHWRRTAEGHWPVRDCLCDRELRGQRLGIVGLGRTGSRVARRAAAFEMKLLAVDPYITDERFARFGVQRVPTLAELVTQVDALTLHCPLTEETRLMVGAAELAALPAGALVVNAARGPVLDADALLAALESNHIAGAALDVWPNEPPPPGPLLQHPRVLPTPHLGGHTLESHRERGENLVATLRELAAALRA